MSLQEARLFVAQFVKGDYTPAEHAAFLQWLGDASMEDLDHIADEHEAREGDWSLRGRPSIEWIAQLEQKLDKMNEPVRQRPVRETATIRRIRWSRWVAAASVLAIVSAGAYLWYTHEGNPGQAVTSKNEIADLSNTVSTSRGQQKQVVLPDGSKVWLNASSSVSYPNEFRGRERIVRLTGEAYFEVNPNATMPFRVRVRDYNIEVLGTHFDVMGYENEPVSRVTLTEGAIKVVSGADERLLQPGDQAEITYTASGASRGIKLVRGVDPENFTSWKSGLLIFNNDDLCTVLRALSRTYDVDVQCNENISSKVFRGSFRLDERLDNILKVLEDQDSHIHFKINNKNIIISQY